MIRRVVVVAGGSPSKWPDTLAYQNEETVWLGVDRGAYYLLQRGIVPLIAVGDFDSLNQAELAAVEAQVGEIKYSIPEKDDTDTQLGLLAALNRYPEAEVILIGATGGRLDHFLSNLWLPLESRFQAHLGQLKICDKQNTISYFLPGSYEVKKELDKKYIAVVCLTAITGLSLIDFKYSLTDYQTDYPKSFASNEFISERASFNFESGIIALIQSKDL